MKYTAGEPRLGVSVHDTYTPTKHQENVGMVERNLQIHRDKPTHNKQTPWLISKEGLLSRIYKRDQHYQVNVISRQLLSVAAPEAAEPAPLTKDVVLLDRESIACSSLVFASLLHPIDLEYNVEAISERLTAALGSDAETRLATDRDIEHIFDGHPPVLRYRLGVLLPHI